MQGRPFKIPGARVVVHAWGVTAGGQRTGYDIDVQPNGHYESHIPDGIYGIDCRAYMPHNGRTLCIDLDPLDGHPDHGASTESHPGIVKDFGLKLWGPVLGAPQGSVWAFHGGKVCINDAGAFHSYFDALTRRYPQGTKVRVVLKPRSALLDGSPAREITLDCDPANMTSGAGFSVPIAVYSATAQIITPDGQAHPTTLGLQGVGPFGPSQDVLFTPEPTDPNGKPCLIYLFVQG